MRKTLVGLLAALAVSCSTPKQEMIDITKLPYLQEFTAAQELVLIPLASTAYKINADGKFVGCVFGSYDDSVYGDFLQVSVYSGQTLVEQRKDAGTLVRLMNENDQVTGYIDPKGFFLNASKERIGTFHEEFGEIVVRDANSNSEYTVQNVGTGVWINVYNQQSAIPREHVISMSFSEDQKNKKSNK